MCMETPLVVGDRRFPSGNPQGRTLPIAPPGIPTGSRLWGWTWTNSSIRKRRRRTGHRRFPSRNSKVVRYPISPPGIPTGFCHEARGCAAEALPWVKAKDINNPNGVVPMVRMGGMCGVYGVDIGNTFLAASSSAPVNPIPFRPFISHPLAGTNGTTPCGVGNALRPAPGVAPGSAQPRAVWHNVVDVGGGELMRAMTHYVHGNAAGGGRSPFPLWEYPRSCLAPSPSGNPNGILP